MSLKKKISALILTVTVGVSGLIGYNAMNPSKPNFQIFQSLDGATFMI